MRLYQRLTFIAMAKASDSPVTPEVPQNYETALSELEQLVSQMESGQMPLDQLLGAYQRGAVLLSYCKDKLAAVEQQIKVLDEGALKPWTPT
jgi:exodeoxyribonuclease VII small subunit